MTFLNFPSLVMEFCVAGCIGQSFGLHKVELFIESDPMPCSQCAALLSGISI